VGVVLGDSRGAGGGNPLSRLAIPEHVWAR
jgi:hypothetical protein